MHIYSFFFSRALLIIYCFHEQSKLNILCIGYNEIKNQKLIQIFSLFCVLMTSLHIFNFLMNEHFVGKQKHKNISMYYFFEFCMLCICFLKRFSKFLVEALELNFSDNKFHFFLPCLAANYCLLNKLWIVWISLNFLMICIFGFDSTVQFLYFNVNSIFFVQSQIIQSFCLWTELFAWLCEYFLP